MDVVVTRRKLHPLWLDAIRRGTLDLCFPPQCVFCGSDLDRPQLLREVEPGRLLWPSDDALCEECVSILQGTEIYPSCGLCGGQVSVRAASRQQVEGEQRTIRCGKCGKDEGFGGLVVLGSYREAMREAVVACKRLKHAPLMMSLGRLLGAKVQREMTEHPIECVTFVPSHWSRRWRRRGTPTQVLASSVAEVLGVPMSSLLRATRRVSKQGMLGDSERRENVLDAFRAKNGYASRWRSVLVVDDVWTTGSTLREAVRALRAAGHAQVVAAVVARAMGERSG